MKKSIFILASLFMLLLTSPIFAQVVDPGDDPDPVASPIDGGISLLVAAGVLFGAKKVNDRRNQ